MTITSTRTLTSNSCAVFHESRRFRNRNEEVHKMLMNARVFVSSDIRTNLVVKQGSTVVESISDRVLIKVEERDHRLVLYLPRNAASFQSCYRSQLPAQLMQTLGIDNSGAEKQIYRLLTEDTLQLENIMVDEDIPHVSWLEKPYIPAKVEDNLHDAYATATLTATRKYVNSLAVGWAPEPPIEKLQPRTHTVEYRQLLERVIRQAQQIPGKEKDRSAFSMTPLGEALDEGPLPSDIRQILGLQRGQAMTFEDNAKIGAAGELFVSRSKFIAPRRARLNCPIANLQSACFRSLKDYVLWAFLISRFRIGRARSGTVSKSFPSTRISNVGEEGKSQISCTETGLMKWRSSSESIASKNSQNGVAYPQMTRNARRLTQMGTARSLPQVKKASTLPQMTMTGSITKKR